MSGAAVEDNYACRPLVCSTLLPGPEPEDPSTHDCGYARRNSWWADYTAAPLVWSRPAKAVVVALFDDGAAVDHSDLRNQLWTNEREARGRPGIDDDGNGHVDDIHGWDFIDSDPNVAPEGQCAQRPSHGTFMASLIAAQRNNGIGIAGAGAGSVKLMVLRITGCGGPADRFDPERIRQALNYAVTMGAQILSFSAHWVQTTPALDTAFAEAADSLTSPHPAIIVASVPNKGEPKAGYPAAYEFRRVIRAIPVGDQDAIAPGTSPAPAGLNLAAPSACILGATSAPDHYAIAGGSSNSTAILSGLLAGIWSQPPYATLGPERFVERVVQARMMESPRRTAPGKRAPYFEGVPIADACLLDPSGRFAQVCKTRPRLEEGRR